MLSGLIDAIGEGFRAPGLQTKIDELERRRAELEAAIASAPLPAPRLHPNLAELYRKKVESLHEALADSATHTEALKILRGLIERATVAPAEDGGFTIELVGEIAGTVALGAEPRSTRAAPFGTAMLSSAKVVAGACNHRGFPIRVMV
jgi:hypothetical protein